MGRILYFCATIIKCLIDLRRPSLTALNQIISLYLHWLKTKNSFLDVVFGVISSTSKNIIIRSTQKSDKRGGSNVMGSGLFGFGIGKWLFGVLLKLSHAHTHMVNRFDWNLAVISMKLTMLTNAGQLYMSEMGAMELDLPLTMIHGSGVLFSFYNIIIKYLLYLK